FQLVTSIPFIASNSQHTLTITKGGTGDSTALIDDIRIFESGSFHLTLGHQQNNLPLITVRGIPGSRVAIHRTDSLTPAIQWLPLDAITLDPQGLGSATDFDSAPITERFYRAELLPP